MIAYLPDGRRMLYEVYIKSQEWLEKKVKRVEYDHSVCCICHLKTGYPQGHHISYEHLGNEDITKDIITLCPKCHENFHNTWGTITGITSQQTPAHWKYYSPDHTLQFFVDYLHEDILLGGEYKMTSKLVIRDFIDQYYRDHSIATPVRISADDIQIFFRNRRLEYLIRNMECTPREFEDFLTAMYGEKGKPGQPNERRSEANKQFKDMAENHCKKAIETLQSPQYRYIENLWDIHVIRTLLKED